MSVSLKSFSPQRLGPICLLLVLSACANGSADRNSGPPTAHKDDAAKATLYQQQLQQNPNDAGTHLALGRILEAHGDNQAAALQYGQALDIAPDDGVAFRDLGRVDLKLGHASDAKEDYEGALALDAHDVKALDGLGISLDYLGNHEAAQQNYKKALDAEPDDLNALNNLAHSYVLIGSYEQAIQLLEPHLKDKRANSALRQNLAEAYGMAGMEADAERVAKMDLSPGQVKHNLDFYRARREQLALVPKLYVDLGSFPTEAMASQRVEQVRALLGPDLDGLVVDQKPEVKTIGGTPIFTVIIRGFAHAGRARSLCDRLQKQAIACKAHAL